MCIFLSQFKIFIKKIYCDQNDPTLLNNTQSYLLSCLFNFGTLKDLLNEFRTNFVQRGYTKLCPFSISGILIVLKLRKIQSLYFERKTNHSYKKKVITFIGVQDINHRFEVFTFFRLQLSKIILGVNLQSGGT